MGVKFSKQTRFRLRNVFILSCRGESPSSHWMHTSSQSRPQRRSPAEHCHRNKGWRTGGCLLLEGWKHGRVEESWGVKEVHAASGATIKWKMKVVRHEVNRWRLTGRRPSIIFLQESTAVSYGTCTQQNFNAKQAKRKSKKKIKNTMLPARRVNWFHAFEPSSILSLSTGSGQARPVLQVWGVCTSPTCCAGSYLPVGVFPWRSLILRVLFFFFFTGSIYKLSHDLSATMSIKAILCYDFSLCAQKSQRMHEWLEMHPARTALGCRVEATQTIFWLI